MFVYLLDPAVKPRDDTPETRDDTPETRDDTPETRDDTPEAREGTPEARDGSTHTRCDIKNGFTLIELMIVVGIISILAMMAIPSYQSYTRRARFTEVITAAESFKTAVALALQEGIPLAEIASGANGIPPSPPPDQNLDSILVANGIITAIGSHLTDDATLVLTPDEEGAHWSITGSCVEKGYCHG